MFDCKADDAYKQSLTVSHNIRLISKEKVKSQKSHNSSEPNQSEISMLFCKQRSEQAYCFQSLPFSPI